MDSSLTKQCFSMNDIKENDVLLGRGPFCYRNPGNIAFRNLIQSHVASYVKYAPRSMKRNIVEQLMFKAQKVGCRFLVRAKSSDMWCEAHPYIVRSKVSHALRDARISEVDVSKDKISNLQATRSDKRKKPKSNGKEALQSFSLKPSSSKVLFEEGNSIPSIDRIKTCPFEVQASVLCQGRQHPQDLKDCANDCKAFLIMKTPEYQSGWNGWNLSNIGNSMSFPSPRLPSCYLWNDSGMTNLKVVGRAQMNYLSALHENGDNTLSENCALHAFNIHHYPNTNTNATSDICGHLAKKSIIPMYTCSNSMDFEVRKKVTHVATKIWCKGPSST